MLFTVYCMILAVICVVQSILVAFHTEPQYCPPFPLVAASLFSESVNVPPFCYYTSYIFLDSTYK